MLDICTENMQWTEGSVETVLIISGHFKSRKRR